MRYRSLQHSFVEHFPDPLNAGILYISLDFGSVAHSCCCGCGEEVVTPLTPTDWRITYDGETISLHPSVGSWTLACRSHYVIDRGRVIAALPWSDKQIEAERRRDRNAKQRFYAKDSIPNPAPPSATVPDALEKTGCSSNGLSQAAPMQSFWSKLLFWRR
jgi:hypothetical protein